MVYSDIYSERDIVLPLPPLYCLNKILRYRYHTSMIYIALHLPVYASIMYGTTFFHFHTLVEDVAEIQ